MMFFDVGDFYDGKVKTDACIINGGMVKSTVQFNGTFYKSRDQGWRDDKVVWGSNVIYEFQKDRKPWECDGIGRRIGLKIRWALCPWGFKSPTPIRRLTCGMNTKNLLQKLCN